MRTLLLVFCALLLMTASMDAKKKMKTPASQNTQVAKQHRAMVKQYSKSHKAPKHHQKVN
jgi:hypothetical protein